MCDFKPGDKVVCVDAGPLRNPATQVPSRPSGLVEGGVYTVLLIRPNYECPERLSVELAEIAPEALLRGVPKRGGFFHGRFRKVQNRLDSLKIESFMTMPGGYEEPRRKAPEKARTGIKAD